MAYEQRWEEYFKVLDANNDGYITLEDATLGGTALAHALGFKEGSEEYNNIKGAYET